LHRNMVFHCVRPSFTLGTGAAIVYKKKILMNDKGFRNHQSMKFWLTKLWWDGKSELNS
jgi:hypothetical protein